VWPSNLSGHNFQFKSAASKPSTGKIREKLNDKQRSKLVAEGVGVKIYTGKGRTRIGRLWFRFKPPTTWLNV